MWKDLTNHKYHSCKGISSTQVKLLAACPLKFKAKYIDKKLQQTPSDSLRMGSLIHLCVLERDKVDSCTFVYEKQNLRTKSGKQKWEGIQKDIENKKKENQDIIPCTKEELETALCVSQSVQDHAAAQRYLRHPDRIIERSGFWTDKDTGVLCKLRPDLYIPQENVIVDLKTTTDASPDLFSRHIAKYGYHISAAFYKRGIEQIDNKTDVSFHFIAVETQYPYCVSVYELNEESLRKGKEIVDLALNHFKIASVTDVWHSYYEDETPISIPNYEYFKEIPNVYGT